MLKKILIANRVEIPPQAALQRKLSLVEDLPSTQSNMRNVYVALQPVWQKILMA